MTCGPGDGAIGTGRRRLLHDEMRVRPAEAEAADGGAAGSPVPALPWPQRGRHEEGPVLEVEVPVRPGEMERRRDGPIAQAQEHLDEADRTGCRQGVADVGLHRPDPAEAPALGAGKSLAQRVDLDRVAQLRAGAVQLDIADRRRIDRRTFRRLPAPARSAPWRSGAVMPLLVPSWFTAEPRITPWIRSPSASAASKGFSTSTAAASPGTKPSAASSSVRHWPVGESMPALPATR